MSFIFGGKAVDPKVAAQERSKQWQGTLRKKIRDIERTISNIERAEAKAKIDAKKAAKDGQLAGAAILAKEIVRSRHTKERLLLAKSNLDSLILTIKNQEGMLRVTNSMRDASSVMKLMNTLMKVSEVRDVVQEMSKEMVKADFIADMVDDAFESLEPDDIEAESDDEVQKVLAELTGAVAKAGKSVSSESASTAGKSSGILPATPASTPSVAPVAMPAAPDEEPEVEIDMAQVQARMAALRAAN